MPLKKKVKLNQEHGQKLLECEKVWTMTLPKCYMVDAEYFYQFYTRIQSINIFLSSIIQTFQNISVIQSLPFALAAYF